jgi:hypothetical protein
MGSDKRSIDASSSALFDLGPTAMTMIVLTLLRTDQPDPPVESTSHMPSTAAAVIPPPMIKY